MLPRGFHAGRKPIVFYLNKDFELIVKHCFQWTHVAFPSISTNQAKILTSRIDV